MPRGPRQIRTPNTALPDASRAALIRLVQNVGEREARERLHISTQTLARCIGGMPVQRGTIALVEQGLRAQERTDAA